MGPRTFFLLIVAVLCLLGGAGDFMVDPRPPLHGGNYLALAVGTVALAAVVGAWLTDNHWN